MSTVLPGSTPETHNSSPSGAATVCTAPPWRLCLPEYQCCLLVYRASMRSVGMLTPSTIRYSQPALRANRITSVNGNARRASTLTPSAIMVRQVLLGTPLPAPRPR
jgi:hypothetical protein